ncbi:MAG: phosphatase family protein, partial [Mucilaginibacter sp.]|nr:phosphatase family protein [Mucilaginibacter sp.]
MDNSEITVKKVFTWKSVISGSLVLAGILLFVYIADEAVIEKEKMFDDLVIGFFDSITGAGLIKAMKVFTFLGSEMFLIPFYIALVAYYFLKKNYLFGIYILIITAGSTALFAGLKLIFHRQRPEHPVIKGVIGYSFPSGHSLSAFVFSSILIYIIWNSSFKIPLKWILSVFLILFATMVGISRIVLKVHYPTDVIASFSLGVVWVIISLWL